MDPTVKNIFDELLLTSPQFEPQTEKNYQKICIDFKNLQKLIQDSFQNQSPQEIIAQEFKDPKYQSLLKNPKLLEALLKLKAARKDPPPVPPTLDPVNTEKFHTDHPTEINTFVKDLTNTKPPGITHPILREEK